MAEGRLFEKGEIFGDVPWNASLVADDAVLGHSGDGVEGWGGGCHIAMGALMAGWGL